MSNTYSVLGMSCGGCASSVTKAIQDAAPGAVVEVNLDAKSISVDGADEATVKQAVEGAGFEFAGAA
ncbi:MAG: heavy-metal-associated domain-containing protein [Magnetovibrio sp.]|nr:heavy-metal-associated domain-containing protein [Magnetovibrio sp.]